MMKIVLIISMMLVFIVGIIFLQAILKIFFIGIFLGIMFGVVGKFIWGIFTKIDFPVNVPVAMQRGDSVVWDMGERGKIFKAKDGYVALRLMKRKVNIKPPKYAHISLDSRGKPVYPLYNTTIGQYFPVKLMNPPKIELVEDPSSSNWAIEELDRINRTYSEKMSKFMQMMPYIMTGTFAAMVIFFVIYYGGKMESVSSSLSGATGSLTNAITKIWGTGGTPVTPVIPSAPVVP